MNKYKILNELNKAETTHNAIISYIYNTFLQLYENNAETLTDAEKEKLLAIISSIEVSEDYTKCFKLISSWKHEIKSEIEKC